MLDFNRDPVPSFYFGVTIQELNDPSSVAGAFTEISGLEIGLDSGAITWEEGGNSVPVKLPGRLKNDAVTLKRYLRKVTFGFGDPLTGWVQETFRSAHTWTTLIKVKNIIIDVYYPQKGRALIIAQYNVIGAYPTKWTMSDLSSTNESDPITETFEFAYRDIERVSVSTATG